MKNKCPWCYSSNHKLSDCYYAINNDTSIYRCKKCTLPHHNSDECNSKSPKNNDKTTFNKSQTMLMSKEIIGLDENTTRT